MSDVARARRVDDQKLTCTCKRQKDLSLRDFSKIRVEGDVELDIRQSGEYSIRYAQGENQREYVNIQKQGDILVISADGDQIDGKVRLEITAPNLVELSLKNSGDVSLHDLDLASFRLMNEGEAKVDFRGNVNKLDVQLSGDNHLQLNGNCNYLTALLDYESRLDAEQFSVRVANITASNDSWVKISAADTLFQHFDESSDLVSKLKTPVVIEK